jgi:GH43 family beta-xylosidase
LLLAVTVTAADDGIVFRDDFQSGRLDHWRLFGGEWQASGGTLTVSGGRGPRAHVRNRQLSDFQLDVDVRIDRPDAQAGVVFRAANAQTGVDTYDGYYAGLHCGANQVVWGAVQHDWDSIARKPAAILPDEWYHLKLQVFGENVVLFVNELPVASGRYPKLNGIDSRFLVGEIGLRALGGGASFRNLTIRDFRRPLLTRSYTNPVQAGCADPAILRHDGQYYAYCTYSPDHPKMPKGIRLYVSRDLVHWKDRGNVLKRDESWGESRFWAPDIVENDGTFYLYYAADTRICVATAKTPLGPFRQSKQQPMLPESIRIDAHVFRDDDGQYYFYYVTFNRGNEIWGGRLNDDMQTVDESSLQLMVEPDQPWERHMGRVTEGAVVIKHNGTYYLTYSGSQFQSPEYAVGYATSESPLGPWQKYEFNPIMKSTAYAHGTAHHCLTTSPDDSEMFIVYHRHHTLTETEPRQMAIDRIQFVAQANGPDILEIHGPTSSPQPLPSGAR